MKITRVLLSANDNPIYNQFWNPISRVYAEKFGIKPTLIWFGENSDIDRLGLSTEYGDIAVYPINPKHHIGWQSAWALFWCMKLYPEDTFCTMGIDQVPLSGMLFKDVIKDIDSESYVMLADNGYEPSHWANTGGTSPTSFHILKGSTAQKVYGFEETFEAELAKIVDSGVVPYYDLQTKWGLDESYSSHKLRQYRDSGGKIDSLSMFKTICENRIECCRVNEIAYDKIRLNLGGYGDAHFCRPFSDHQIYIENILNLIPVCL